MKVFKVALVLSVTSILSVFVVERLEAQMKQMKGSTMQKNIVETAVAAGSFNTLVAAVKAAGLVETLSGKGPFTVFAPTDEAFAKLPKGTIEALLADTAQLRKILTYHVVLGKVMACDAVKVNSAATVNGGTLTIRANGTGVMVDEAKVVKTDIVCSNGVIHVLDAVVLPKDKDIVQTAIGAGSFNPLVAALKAAGLVETLQGKGPFTVFAPSDEAFAKLSPGTLELLLKDKVKLTAILMYHVVPGRVTSVDATKVTSAITVQGKSLAIDTKNGVRVDEARVVGPDILASNGIIHVIDQVLLPN